jgi:hypothetical protein
MWIHIASNFHIPGLKGESVAIENGCTVRQLLESVSSLSGETLVFFEHGKDTLDPDDWEVDVNGIPLDGFQIQAETALKENDVVEIRLLMYSGG